MTQHTCNTSESMGSLLTLALTPALFRAWLKARLDAGESRAEIGRSLGVTHEAVRLWIKEASGVSATVLLLAERLIRDQSGSWPLG